MTHGPLDHRYRGEHPVRTLLYLFREDRAKLALGAGAFFVKHSPTWLTPVITAHVIDVVVRDLGASLGKTSSSKLLWAIPVRGLGQGSRNDIDDFESQNFIKRIVAVGGEWGTLSEIALALKAGKPGNVDRWQIINFQAPSTIAIDVGVAPTGTGAPEGDRSQGVNGFGATGDSTNAGRTDFSKFEGTASRLQPLPARVERRDEVRRHELAEVWHHPVVGGLDELVVVELVHAAAHDGHLRADAVDQLAQRSLLAEHLGVRGAMHRRHERPEALCVPLLVTVAVTGHRASPWSR